MTARLATIFGCEGHRLTDWEKGFFKASDPFGFILFARNIDAPDQLRSLVSELRDAVGWNAPILIDQEGGRVQRMRAPHWREYLPALDQMACASDPIRAAWLRNRLIAAELQDVGIDVNCAPLADLVEPETHPVLRNRLYGGDINTVVEISRITAAAHLAGGVLPVLKHIPGYGRATVDGHLALPRVSTKRADLMARDFKPFMDLNHIQMGMTAHIVFENIDPDLPTTTSPTMMRVIRDDIGFDGLLMTDDISMEALSGSVVDRAIASLNAGCDLVLHCNGDSAEMHQISEAIPQMTNVATARAKRALDQRQTPVPIDIAACSAELDALLH